MEYSNQIIENLLKEFIPVLAKDYRRYRNHVYRVYLNCLSIDTEKSNEEYYALAAVFHDIGIWTDNTIDYLDPSIQQAVTYLQSTDKREWVDEISMMIAWHHKISIFRGNHYKLVETFRKADWIDVSMGLIHFRVDRSKIKNNRKGLPNLGFHAFLLKKLFYNFLVHPLNPLPMFRK